MTWRLITREDTIYVCCSTADITSQCFLSLVMPRVDSDLRLKISSIAQGCLKMCIVFTHHDETDLSVHLAAKAMPLKLGPRSPPSQCRSSDIICPINTTSSYYSLQSLTQVMFEHTTFCLLAQTLVGGSLPVVGKPKAKQDCSLDSKYDNNLSTSLELRVQRLDRSRRMWT